MRYEGRRVGRTIDRGWVQQRLRLEMGWEQRRDRLTTGGLDGSACAMEGGGQAERGIWEDGTWGYDGGQRAHGARRKRTALGASVPFLHHSQHCDVSEARAAHVPRRCREHGVRGPRLEAPSNLPSVGVRCQPNHVLERFHQYQVLAIISGAGAHSASSFLEQNDVTNLHGIARDSHSVCYSHHRPRKL